MNDPSRLGIHPVLLGAILTLLIALPVMANDLIFVALPSARVALGADPAGIQLAMSAYLIAFASVQLIYGPLSDRYGRRPVLLVTASLFVLASLMCAIAETLEIQILARALQGMGSGAGPALARAVMRDVYGPERSGPVLSYIMSLFGVVAIAAPVIGGGLVEGFGWRAVFVFAAAYSAPCVLLIWRVLPETAPLGTVDATLGRAFRNFSALLARPTFMILTCCNTAFYAGMFVWLVGAVFVLIEALGLSAGPAGILFAISLSGFAFGSLAAGRLAGRHAPLRLVAAGGLICLAASVVGTVLAWAGITHVAAVITPGFVVMVGIGLIIPPATSAGIAVGASRLSA